jgi:hypothetical protein
MYSISLYFDKLSNGKSETDLMMESIGLMNTREAAAYLGVEVHWLQTHWKSEAIPTIRYTAKGPLLFRKSALDAWVASKEQVWVDPVYSERQKSKSHRVQLVS